MNTTRAVAGALMLALSIPAAAEPVGVTKRSIKIGGTFPFSGPASALGNTGKGLVAYINMTNDRGGVNGRKIEYIALDDGYSPPKAVEQGRKLVEQEEVAFMFSPLGTASNSATIKYFNSKNVPDAFIISGASRFAVAKDYPFTTTGMVSYENEAKIYARYAREKFPQGKIGILFQNDDLGKDFAIGFKSVYGDDFAKLVTTVSYEITDPTIDSQILKLKDLGVEVVMVGGTPKFAAQAIRKTAEVGWKPLLIINVVSSSIAATLKPAGFENAIGVVTAANDKDPADERWANDQGVKDYLAFAAKYLPGSDPNDVNYITGYNQGGILEQLLKQAGDDLTRENIVKQMHSIKDVALPMLLPGLKANTSETRNAAFTQLQLQRWTGTKWELFRDVIEGDAGK